MYERGKFALKIHSRDLFFVCKMFNYLPISWHAENLIWRLGAKIEQLKITKKKNK